MENSINRPLGATCKNGAKTLMPDAVTWGDSDAFKLISKFSSETAGIMKSTKAMDTGNGCLIQVTTQQRNPDGSYAIAEAVTFAPNTVLIESREEASGPVVSRWMVPQHVYDEQYRDPTIDPIPEMDEE